jgi:putative phage-type endonuclease
MSNVLIKTKGLSKEEWLKWRSKGIGGSDVAAICGLNKYKSPVEVWMEKAGQSIPKEQSEAAYWGSVLEPLVRQEFALRANMKVKLKQCILKHSQHDFMIANIDGVVIDNNHGECLFEAKTASAYKQNQWEDSIPEEYMLQIQHYMAVTGYKRTYIAVLIGGNNFKYKIVERDDELIKMIIKLEHNFWNNYVLTNTTPPIDGSEASSELLNSLFSSCKENSEIVLTDEALPLITQYEIAKEKEKEANEIKNDAINKIKLMIGDNEKGLINDKIITWKSITTEKFDTKKLHKEMPDIYDKYLSKSSFRRFSIK